MGISYIHILKSRTLVLFVLNIGRRSVGFFYVGQWGSSDVQLSSGEYLNDNNKSWF